MSALDPTSTEGEPATADGRTPRWLFLAIAILFGLFYAYDAWEGVGNLVGLGSQAQFLGTSLSGLGWGLLIAGVLLPVAVFALAIRLGRARGALAQALLLLAGLCLVAALSADSFIFGLGSLIV